MIQSLNERDEHIINAVPEICKTVADIGAGGCRLSYYLAKKGFDVTAFDIYKNKCINDYPENSFKFIYKSLFDITEEFDTVICSHVIEHIKEWKMALSNLIKIAKCKLIVNIPWKKSFFDPTHINFWDDTKNGYFESVDIFQELVKPYNITINKIYSKQADRRLNQMDYMIEVQK